MLINTKKSSNGLHSKHSLIVYVYPYGSNDDDRQDANN